ncbi:hypothetical protein [Eisenbergiella tayi]|uniref:hypothetical protein n=1 Tax=Eisenbergiella tayi TaxID=1432052 RepID=UPI0008485A18|nr:hypothetical protein [Eisenbergiella tayi]ODR42459.1 hypothetical protein BEI60_03225 [Eisenbergiella tayi]
MEEWKKIQKACKTREVIGIIGMIMSIIIGAICDWDVLVERNILIPIDAIESFSLTILQIQATVGTLIITIIALITGNISDSYMGVYISDFNLNIKPWKLTQKVLIIVSLGLCLAGVIFHSLSLYNIVFYLFVATLIVILISILEIYSAFKGRNKQNQEIESYVYYILDSDIEYEKKLNMFQNFVLNWKKVIDSQDKQSYEKFLEIFEKCVSALWTYRTDEALSSIEQQCYSIAYCLLGSEKKALKEKGLEFVQETYDILWNVIHNSITKQRPLLNQYKSEFSFFTEIYSELIRSIDEMNVEDVEKRLKFDNLTESVLRVSIWLRYDKGKEVYNAEDKIRYKRYKYNYQSDISELNSFAKYIGYYLGKQNNKNNMINQNIWASVLNKWSLFSDYNIPEERAEDFLMAKVNIYFCYCYGMLVNGQENIVKVGLYLTGMGDIVKLDNKYQALLYLVVHCYIYYLAVRESDDCVPEDIRESVLNIWDDKSVKEVFWAFLNKLSINSEWLDLDILDKMYEIVNSFELFPRYKSTKAMIIEPVISDFYLFLILFMSHEYFLPELLKINIDDMRAFRYVSKGNEDKTKEMFGKLYRMTFIGNKSEEQIDKEVDLMYDDLEKMVKKKQKERYIRLAKEAQENYVSKINEEEICEKIKNDTIKSIKEKFAPILVESDEKNGIIDVNLLKLNDYTISMGTKNSTDGYYSHMNGMFLYGIERFLCQRRVVEFKKRFDDFVGDKEFMDYLAANNFQILLGSQCILKNRDYKISAEYKRFLEDYETIYTTVLRDGIALKRNSIQVCLHDINVSVHSPSIKEEDVEYDKETGKYKYSILNGLPIDFDEDELREFLYNNRKVINIKAKISVQVNEKPCGTIFNGRQRG